MSVLAVVMLGGRGWSCKHRNRAGDRYREEASKQRPPALPCAACAVRRASLPQRTEPACSASACISPPPRQPSRALSACAGVTVYGECGVAHRPPTTRAGTPPPRRPSIRRRANPCGSSSHPQSGRGPAARTCKASKTVTGQRGLVVEGLPR
eukprot:363047-Chlamydomonas_euryale.AAC.6